MDDQFESGSNADGSLWNLAGIWSPTCRAIVWVLAGNALLIVLTLWNRFLNAPVLYKLTLGILVCFDRYLKLGQYLNAQD